MTVCTYGIFRERCPYEIIAEVSILLILDYTQQKCDPTLCVFRQSMRLPIELCLRVASVDRKLGCMQK